MPKINTPEERAALIDECRSSGLAIAGFCRERGIGYSTMFKWLRDAGMPVQKEQERIPETPRFVELEMEGRENGAARPVARPAKKACRPAAALCAELILPGRVVLRVYHNGGSTGGEGGAACVQRQL